MRMHADEADIDEGLVRRLVAEQFPQWAGLPVEPVPSAGTVNALYQLGADLAVRLPRIKDGVEDVAHEHRWLPRLAPLLPVAVPTVVAQGVPAAGYPWPWSVYRWLEGEPPVQARVDEPEQLAADLAGFVAALRAVDPTGGPAAARGRPLARQDRATRAAIADLAGMIDTTAATAAWDAALAAPEWAGAPVWVHGDLMPSNMLVQRGRLSAVIDFATMGVGDPAIDLIAAWNLLPAGAREIFRDVLAPDDATWARGRGWALSMALIQLPYYQDTNPGIAANARHVIRAVLTG